MDGWSITILAVQYQVIALIRQRSCKPSSLLVTIDCHAIKCHRAEPMINSLFDLTHKHKSHHRFLLGRTGRFCQMPSISRRHFGSAKLGNRFLFGLVQTNYHCTRQFLKVEQTSRYILWYKLLSNIIGIYYCLKHFKNA